MSDLAKPVSFENLVRDKVKQVIFDSMPDDQIDNLVRKEFQAYFDDPKDYWGKPNGQSSEFRKLVFREMADSMKPLIVDAIDSFLKSKHSGESSDIDNWMQKFSQDFVEQMAPVVMRTITQDLITTAFNNFRNQIR